MIITCPVIRRSILLPILAWWLCVASVTTQAGDITLTALYRTDSADARILQPSTRAAGVSIVRGERRFAAGAGVDILDGDILETGPASAAQVSFAPGHRVLVLPGTRVRLGNLYLFIGELLVRARGVFHIETSFMSAGVEGTEFLMRVKGEDDRGEGDKVEVIVTEGAVLCRSNTALWSPVRVAAAEHLRAQSVQSTPESNGMNEGTVLFRGPGNSTVRKAPARGSDLSRIQMLAREVDTSRR